MILMKLMARIKGITVLIKNSKFFSVKGSHINKYYNKFDNERNNI